MKIRQSPDRSNKRSKLSPETDSDRIITLTQKKVKARLFEKTNLRNKKALNKLKSNDDSPEEKILVTIQVQKPQTPYSLTPKILKKKEKEEWKKVKIYNERIFLRKRNMSLLPQKVHAPVTFLTTRVFQPHYWIFSSLGGYKEMVNAFFRALCKLAFGDDSFL